ncbi:hypothetical protein D3C71_1234470 [compost metagenome]
MNNIANANAASSNAPHSTQSACGREARTSGSSPTMPDRVTAITAPTVSFRIVVTAPANRAVPETQCWLASSLTALVSDIPGSSTTSEAMITVLRFSAPMKEATSVATEPASSAANASLASRVAGRRSVYMPMTPISRPITPAVAISSHGSFHRPATPAAPRL